MNRYAFIGKKCARCEESLPPSAFYVDRHRRDGLSSYCRVCRKERNRERRRENPQHVTALEARLNRTPNRRIARQAQDAVNNAVKRGMMAPIKTRRCVYCGNQAKQYHHHNGYDRQHWLDVIPICKCHGEVERLHELERSGQMCLPMFG